MDKDNNNNEEFHEQKRKIEVVTGNGKDLNISPVYHHIEVEKPKEEKKENIIIPEEKK